MPNDIGRLSTGYRSGVLGSLAGLMACEGCERRRKEMALMLEASRQWTSNPFGPNVREIFIRLRNEAIVRGDFDADQEHRD